MITHMLTLPSGERLPTLNELTRGKLAARVRLGKEAKFVVAWAKTRHEVPEAKGPRRVDIHINVPKNQRRWDVDAFWKVTLDSLVACKLLINDGPRWCRTGDVKYTAGESLLFRIILTDLGDKALE